jgi:hypothetical protein
MYITKANDKFPEIAWEIHSKTATSQNIKYTMYQVRGEDDNEVRYIGCLIVRDLNNWSIVEIQKYCWQCHNSGTYEREVGELFCDCEVGEKKARARLGYDPKRYANPKIQEIP